MCVCMLNLARRLRNSQPVGCGEKSIKMERERECVCVCMYVYE